MSDQETPHWPGRGQPENASGQVPHVGPPRRRDLRAQAATGVTPAVTAAVPRATAAGAVPAAGTAPAPAGAVRPAPAATPSWARPPVGSAPRPGDERRPDVAGPATTLDQIVGPATVGPAAPAVDDKRRSRTARRRRGWVVLLVALAMVVGAAFLVWSVLRPGGSGTAGVHDYPGAGSPSAQVVIATGASGTAMGRALQAAGVVATVDAFVSAYDGNPDASKIQPGTYLMNKQMKASLAVQWLLDPTHRQTFRVTIPEGLTATQILQKISEKTAIPLADLQSAAADPNAIRLPAQAGGKVEGWLFPATYDVQPTDTAASVLTQMTTKTVAVLTADGVASDQWQAVLTKASIVEKEAKLDADRPMMARVIENRLAAAMPLQVDTSVAYGAGKPAMDLTAADFENADNAYNTYKHSGLPPTPIASPGEVSIDAVLAPADGTWLYWTTVNLDTGETKFATTQAEKKEIDGEYQAWKAAHAASGSPTP